MVLTEQGIARGWQIEQMPEPRVMPDAVILPTGEIVIVNGAKSGSQDTTMSSNKLDNLMQITQFSHQSSMTLVRQMESASTVTTICPLVRFQDYTIAWQR